MLSDGTRPKTGQRWQAGMVLWGYSVAPEPRVTATPVLTTRARGGASMATDNPTPPIVFGDPRLPTHFWAKVRVDPTTGCWIWTGAKTPGGYGAFRGGSRAHGDMRMVVAHRYCHETLIGPVPDGLELDHFKFGLSSAECSGPACIHPDHTRPVTHRENALRGDTIVSLNAAKEGCPQGHPYDHVSSRNSRCCLDCRKRRQREARRRRLAGAPDLSNAAKNRCPSGHVYDRVGSRGGRACHECHRRHSRESWRRRYWANPAVG